MLMADRLGQANSDVFGQGILEIGQGKVSEKSGNFTFYILWEPWIRNMTTFRKQKIDLLTPPRSRGCVYGQHICFHGALCSIPFNYHHAFLKKRRGYCNRLRPSVRPSVCPSV